MELREIISCYPKNKDRWEKLQILYNNSKIVPFLGAGMSTPVYSLWAESIKHILNGTIDENNHLDALFSENKYEEACEYVKNTVGTNVFIERVQSEFSSKKITECSEEEWKKVNSCCLNEVFYGPVFTTNFDKVIEYSYNSNFDNEYRLSNMQKSWSIIYDAIREYNHNIFKIHGDVDDPDSWVFSKQQYIEAYGRPDFVAVIKTVCENMTFLFLGCSLTENDRFVKVLREVVEGFENRNISIRNYAFMSLPDGNGKSDEDIRVEIEKKERELGNLGIFPIWYPYKKHESVATLLKALKESVDIECEYEDDQTGKEKHFNLFSSRISVNEAFVDDCFEHYSISSNLDCSPSNPIQLDRIVELVEANNLLYIEGRYGSGKTVLSKRIQWELQKKYKTLFFRVEDFIKNDKITEALIKTKKKCFVFIDAVDKIVDNCKNPDVLSGLCKKIESVVKNKNNTVILNSRLYFHIGESTSDEDYISANFALEMSRDSLHVIKTNGFTKKEQYETFFKNINKEFGSNIDLTGKTIKQWHKKSPLSCQVPLFAYAIGTYYYGKQKQMKGQTYLESDILPDNKMIIYEEFVKNTIKGRFREECMVSHAVDNMYQKYEQILRLIAIKMINKMRNKIDYKEDSANSQDFSYDEIYGISVSEFDVQIQQRLHDMISEGKRSEFSLSDAINNYFFHVYESEIDDTLQVRFSDINVMSCFAADYIYEIVAELWLCKDDDELKRNYKSIINRLGLVELQPQVMDFLICKIRNVDSDNRDMLLVNILKCINIYNSEQNVSPENVKAMLVLYILFIKFSHKSYIGFGAANVLKSFYRLCMIAKAFNINGVHVEGDHRYLAERYFMECTFIECKIKRLNYKYYNFTRSRIVDTLFEQCNFLDTIFVDATLKNVTFKLCTIKKTFEKTIFVDEVVIENSIINQVKFEDIKTENKGSRIRFVGCTMQGVTICDLASNALCIKLECCTWDDIKIRSCKGIAIDVINSTKKSKISVGSNCEIYSDTPEWFDGEVKSLDSLDNNDIRKKRMSAK